MSKPSSFARAAAWFACAAFVTVSASCQKIIGIEDLATCGACYSGRSATKDVGACKAGCPSDGGECVGEVLPKTEDCSTPTIDDNCDGKTACTGEVVWSASGASSELPNPSQVGPTSYLALDAREDVLVVGSSLDGVRIGKLSPELPGNAVAYAAKLSRDDGTAAFATIFAASGSTGNTVGSDIAALPKDLAVIGGYYSGDFTKVIGGAPKTDGDSAFVVQIETEHGLVVKGTGAVLASKDSSLIHIFSVATLPAGDVFACGEFLGTMQLPDGTTKTAAEGYDAFVVHFDKDQKVVGKKFFGGDGDDFCEWIRIGPNNEVAIAGTYGSSDFVIGKKLPPSTIGPNIFAAVLDQNLEPKFAVGLVGTDPDANQDVAGIGFDASSGNVVIGGYFSRSLTLGSSTHRTSRGNSDLFVASLKSDGETDWFKAFGDDADQEMNGIAVDGAGQIVVAGSFAGRLQADDCDIVSSGGDHDDGSDAFVLKLLRDGKGLWCKRGGTKDTGEGATSVVTDSLGNVFVSTNFPGNSFAYPGGPTSLCDDQSCETGFNFTRFDP